VDAHETIPELQPLPEELTRRRWWPSRRRKRDYLAFGERG
jgi:hypothetical protein